MQSIINYTQQVYTVYPKKYAHGFVVLCFVVVMKSFIMNSHEVFIHIHQGCFAGTEAIVRLPQCQWSKPDGYGKISQCITTTKHSKAKTVCIFLGIYCISTLPKLALSANNYNESNGCQFITCTIIPIVIMIHCPLFLFCMQSIINYTQQVYRVWVLHLQARNSPRSKNSFDSNLAHIR